MSEQEPMLSYEDNVGVAESLRKPEQTLEDTLDELAQLADSLSPEEYVEIVRGMSKELTEEQKGRAAEIVKERVDKARTAMADTENSIKTHMMQQEVEEIRSDRNPEA